MSDDFVNQLGGPEKPKPLKARRTIAGKQGVLATAKTATRVKATKSAVKKVAKKKATKPASKTAVKKKEAKS